LPALSESIQFTISIDHRPHLIAVVIIIIIVVIIISFFSFTMEMTFNDTPDATIAATATDNQSMGCHVRYVEEYKVLLCISCGHGIVPGSGIRRHLIDHHKEIPLALRKKIIAYGASLELDEPHTCMAKLSSSMTVLNGFTLIHGWKCNEFLDDGSVCRKVYGSAEKMRKHCSEKHR
jgi:hypothetical protein